MLGKDFTSSVLDTIRLAYVNAAGLGHSYVGSEHLVLGLAGQAYSPAACALKKAGADRDELKAELARMVGVGTPTGTLRQGLTRDCCRAVEQAGEESRKQGRERINSEHLLLGILGQRSCGGVRLLEGCGVETELLRQTVYASLGGNDRIAGERSREPEVRAGGETRQLDQCSRDLTQMAVMGELDPMIGREEELERVIRILSRRTKNNPALIGEPGVGKTAIAEGLALAIADGTAPGHLLGKRVCALDLSAMVAGTKYRGEFEDKLRRVLEEVRRAGNVILFLDELHTIMGAGSAEGAIDAANILKPALARGEIQILGATTREEYRRHIEKDAALERRFQPVTVREPDREQTLNILRGLRGRYESHHRVTIEDGALEAAVELSIRYLPQRFLPDKAIDLVDEAASRARLAGRLLPPELQSLQMRAIQARRQINQAVQQRDFEKAALLRDAEASFRGQLREKRALWLEARSVGDRQVKEADVRAVLSQWTGVPVTDPDEADRRALEQLDRRLKEKLIGQDRAVEAVVRSIRRSRLGLKAPDRPVGAFLLLGPSGVGKTQLCRSLAEVLFGDPKALLRFDMSEYREPHSLSRLIGAPPGYVGHEDGGQLTERVRKQPWSVVLLDELEKAHRDVWAVLLQVMEEGVLTDGQGRETDFRNTVLVMTSNLGAGRFRQGNRLGFCSGGAVEREQVEQEVLADARRTFAPEFLNRLDSVLVFHPLEQASLRQIAGKLLGETGERLDKLGVKLEVEQEALELLCSRGSSREYGARPLRRAVVRWVEDPAADLMLAGTLGRGDTLLVRAVENRLTVQKKAAMS